jgi:hypothetical protein
MRASSIIYVQNCANGGRLSSIMSEDRTGVPLAHSSVEFNPCLVPVTSGRSGVRRPSPVLSARDRLGLAHYPRIFWESCDWPNAGPARDEEVFGAL